MELENFKSFGRKLTIPFLEGFTAITGPNGSGKSNIGDAILFVLGPKSNKAIRAGRLTDLIFNGGKEKKPSTHCKVSLVFANEDRVIPVETNEVTLTRLVKLSKTSKENYYSYFYVNGKPSSLTEFDMLLAHSRISAEGYNIVRQGDVLRIVDMTALERRRILDDIAGITKFDADIEKAGKERTAVEQNLEKIGIILDEIDRQLETLEREKEMAVKYKAIKEDLDVNKAKLAHKRRGNMRTELAGVHDHIAKQEAEREKLAAQLEGLRVDLDAAEKALKDIDDKIAERGGDEARELREKIEVLRGESIRATERLNYAKQEIGDLKKDRATLQQDLKRIAGDVKKHEASVTKAQDGKAEAEVKLGEKQKGLDGVRDAISQGTGKASDINKALAQLKIDHERAGNELHQKGLDRDRLTEKADRLKGQVAELGDQIETHTFEIKDVDWELKEIEKESGSVTGSLEEQKKKLFSHKKRESEISGEIRDLDAAVRRLQNDYSRRKAEQDASEAVSRGFSRAVEAVLEARDKGELNGICGTIAELGKVEGKYETAMEIAAGGRMQAIITESDADAARAIDFLKKNALGRATFLPLSKMVAGRPAGKPLMAVRDTGAEGFAIDLIRYDDRFKAAFWYVFRDTVVVKSMDVARKLMGGTRLVTLDGDIIDAAGAMTGGDTGKRRGRGAKPQFGANSKDELEKAGRELRAAVAHQEALSAELIEVRETIAQLDGAIRSGSGDATAKADRVKELKKRRDEYAARLDSFKGERDAREKELSETLATVEKAEVGLAELEARIGDMETKRDELGKLLLASTSKELASELSMLEVAVADLRETVRDAAKEVETRQANLDLLRERHAEVEAKVADIDAGITGHLEALKESEETVKAREQDLKVLLKLESEQNEELKGLQQERDAAFEHRSDVAQKIGKVTDRVDTTNDLIVTLNAKIPTLEEALQELEDEVATYDGIAVPDDIEETVEQLRGRIRSLESQLDALGNVNMLALEEYERQAARKDELTGEVERLNVERENLIALVDEIVERKKEGFFKVFHEINTNVQSVFQRLSNGGKAELVLENPDMPFEGGLLLRAQPKGKKLTRLEALSGGEKSLTSMAFIFAIQEFDPSPFYYLDEVDQNLDGINSELLARMVRSNAHAAQTIVVSLRKVTLKEAEHVYGVTMTDSGVSEVVGEVRISEIVDQPDPAQETVMAAHAEEPDAQDDAPPAAAASDDSDDDAGDEDASDEAEPAATPPELGVQR